MTAQLTVDTRTEAEVLPPLEARLRLPAAGLSHTVVLRAFDILRRRVALGLTHSEGAFVGYERLRLLPVPQDARGEVVFTAMVVDVGPRRHRVAYEAVLLEFPGADARNGQVLATGTGLTVAIA